MANIVAGNTNAAAGAQSLFKYESSGFGPLNFGVRCWASTKEKVGEINICFPIYCNISHLPFDSDVVCAAANGAGTV